jgi:NADPH2:quinone reductase
LPARLPPQDWLIDYTSENLKTAIAEKTGRKDVDVIYDPVGGDYSEKAFRCMAPGGRHLVLGFTAGNIPSIALNLPLVKEASIITCIMKTWRSCSGSTSMARSTP